jgi:hypothetical protein
MNYASPTYEHSRPRTLQSDLAALRARVAAAVAAQPIAATAAAAGIGFVLGSRMARPAVAFLVDTAARAAATWVGEAIRQTTLAHLEPEDPRDASTPNDNTGESRS